MVHYDHVRMVYGFLKLIIKQLLKILLFHFLKNILFFPQRKPSVKGDFSRFLKIVEILDCHKSTTFNDLQQILNLLDEIESKASRKYTNQEILERASLFWSRNQEKIEILNRKSSETTR